MTMRSMLPLFALAFVFGCAHKQEVKPDPRPTAAAPAPTPPPPAPAARASTCNRDTDCGDKQLCIRGQCVDISAGLAECLQTRVYFPLNSSDLDNDSRSSLERSARCLKADHAIHIAVEGNADERGTEEYNMALGDRRATNIAHYLESLGASQAQLKTVSYGKENPLCTEHDEECWAKNRRGELKLSDGAKRKKK
jgi:peptidoglycan-associated lipoprotein